MKGSGSDSLKEGVWVDLVFHACGAMNSWHWVGVGLYFGVHNHRVLVVRLCTAILNWEEKHKFVLLFVLVLRPSHSILSPLEHMGPWS